ncbi:hypothetical protein ACNOYE_32310 [Nannocystaceae bacterium ST9]
MSKAAELIAGLQTQAHYDSEGGFSLDREKARQKMRQFQLADPHRYVLLLVEFAALRGASKIEFEIDADDMHMRCDAVLDWEDLDELYTSLFVDRSGAGIRARRELALACNAVMALNPKFVAIESYGPDGGVRALLRPDAPDEVAEVEALEPQGTRIHVKERFRPGLLVRFVLDSQGTLPEELLLRERCKGSSLPITLDGAPISGGLPEHLIAAVPFETEDLRGVAGLDPARLDRSGIVLLSNGVEIATHELRDSVPGLWFWVDGRALRKDVSQADIARGDPTYAAMLGTIAAARDRVLGELAEAWRMGKFAAGDTPSADDVFKLLSLCFMRWASADWLRPDAGPLGSLAELPLWRTTDDRWLDSRAVASSRVGERGVLYSLRSHDGVIPDGWGTILHPWSGDDEVAAIGRVFVEVEDVTSELARKVPIEKARRQWRARPHEPRLPQGHWPVRMPFAVGEHRGEVSLRPGRRTNVRVIVEGCLLHEVEFEGPLIGVTAVLEGPYLPLADYSRAQLDATWASGLLVVLAQLPALLEGWANVHGLDAAEYVRATSIALCDPSMPARWLEAFGYKAGKPMVERLGAPYLLPRLALDQPQPGILAQIIRFETVDRRKVSLVELERERHVRDYQRGKLLVVVPDAPYLPDVQALVVRASAEERRMLVALFGEGCLIDDTETLQRQVSREEFRRRPKLAPSRPQPSTSAIEIRHADLHGFVAIDAAELRKLEGGRVALIDVVYEDRLLGQVKLPTFLPGVRASLSWPSAPVNPTWSGVSGSLAPLAAALHHGLAELIREQVERCIQLQSRPAGDVRRLIWAAIVAPFLGAEHYAAWRWFRSQSDDLQAAIAGYWPIFELFPQYDVDAIGEALSLLRSDERAPDHAALVDLLGEPKRGKPLGESREFHRRMLELSPGLERLPMFETFGRRSVGLGELIAAFTQTGSVAWIDDPNLAGFDEGELIVRADVDDRAGFIRLFGEDAPSEASARLRELQQRQQFSTRKPLERIVLDAPIEGVAGSISGRSSTMIAVEFAGGGFEGQLAIPPWAPSESAPMSALLCHRRRPVESVEIHAALPVLGIIDDEQLEFEVQFSKVSRTSSRMAALRKRIDEVLHDQLLPRLAESYTELAPGGRSIAWAWITLHWLRTAEGAGDDPNRLGELGRRFAALPGFVDLDGQPRSLDELIRRYQAVGTLYTIEQASALSWAASEPVLLLRGEDRAVIPRLFAKRTDYAPLLREAAEGHERHRKAPEAPALATIPAPASVLVRVDLDQHGLAGALWVPAQYPFDAGVAMVCRGRVVERIGLASPGLVASLAIQGLVLGEVASDRRFTRAELSTEQRRYLIARVVQAYAQLLDEVRVELEHPERLDLREVEPARRRAVRLDILRNAAVALTLAQRRGLAEDPPIADLRRALSEVPLLRLNTGRLISIAVGEQVRPIELNHLGLWEPREPAEEQFESTLFGALAEAGEQAESARKDPETQAERDEQRVGLAMLASLMGQAGRSRAKLEVEVELPVQAAPSPEPATSPRAEPVVPARDLVGELLEAIREELRMVREGQESLLAEGLLDKLRAEPGRGRGPLVKIDGAVVFDSKHPCFVQALDDREDPIWVSFLASVAYTALNHWQDQVTDADELSFHARHAALLASGVLSPAE